MNSETALEKLRIQRQIIETGIITGLLTSAWIGFEYLTGQLFGIPQLGPLYGLVSIALFILMIRYLLLTTRRISQFQSYLDGFRYGIAMIFVASIVVVLFLLMYYSAMDPALYQTYEIEVFNIHLDHVLLTSIVGAWVGTLAEGFVITAIAAAFIRTKKK